MPGSYCDQYQDTLERVMDSGDISTQIKYATEFYRRARGGHWHMNVELDSPWDNYIHGVKLCFTFGTDNKLTVAFDEQSGRFSQNGVPISDASLAELFGVPISYIEGLLGMLRLVMLRVRDALLAEEKARRSRHKSIEERKKVRVANTRQLPDASDFFASECVDQCRPSELSGFRELTVSSFIQCETQSFVYFLVRNGVVVYVGQTRCGTSRPFSHVGKGKQFDRIFYLECDESLLDSMERKCINRFMPEYNNDLMTQRCRCNT